jgi:hypothetical protein
MRRLTLPPPLPSRTLSPRTITPHIPANITPAILHLHPLLPPLPGARHGRRRGHRRTRARRMRPGVPSPPPVGVQLDVSVGGGVRVGVDRRVGVLGLDRYRLGFRLQEEARGGGLARV